MLREGLLTELARSRPFAEPPEGFAQAVERIGGLRIGQRLEARPRRGPIGACEGSLALREQVVVGGVRNATVSHHPSSLSLPTRLAKRRNTRPERFREPPIQ